jgi:hypothetical protein
MIHGFYLGFWERKTMPSPPKELIESFQQTSKHALQDNEKQPDTFFNNYEMLPMSNERPEASIAETLVKKFSSF